MHAIHHTEAIILKSTEGGEANKRVWLFTKELGLIIATVQGVRKPGAKLQSHTTDYSVIQADLIKGREVWRLISAKTSSVPLAGNLRNPLARAYVRTLTLLTRFLIGEGEHEELYAHVLECAEVVQAGIADAKTVDAVSLWKMLVLLGYIAPNEHEQFIIAEPLSLAVAKVPDALRTKLTKDAQHAIAQSHL